jgi:hypothetical protein
MIFRIIFFFSILLLFMTTILAQITVTNATIAPVGTSWTYHSDAGMVGVQIPPGGSNQTWNEPTHSFGFHYPTQFVNPSSTPYSADFPSATHCVNTTIGGGGSWAYMEIAGSEFKQLGYGQNIAGQPVVHYNPTSLIMPVPLTYPHSPWTRVYQYEIEVIPGFVSTIRDSAVITLDGWGTLTTQYGTFQVLRTLEQHWRTEWLNGQNPTYHQSVSYAWFDERGITILSYTNPSDSINFTTASIVEAEISPSSTERISSSVPENFQLAQNYPNPFNPNTKIQFSIPEQKFVTLEVFNALGEKVSLLISQELNAGIYELDWNAKGLQSGIYFYTLTAGSFTLTRKMVLLK